MEDLSPKWDTGCAMTPRLAALACVLVAACAAGKATPVFGDGADTLTDMESGIEGGAFDDSADSQDTLPESAETIADSIAGDPDASSDTETTKTGLALAEIHRVYATGTMGVFGSVAVVLGDNSIRWTDWKYGGIDLSSAPTNIVGLSGSYQSLCVLTGSGSFWCAGRDNDAGAFGVGTRSPDLYKTFQHTLLPVAATSGACTAGGFCCARDGAGDAWCWGAIGMNGINYNAMTPVGSAGAAVPTQLVGLPKVDQLVVAIHFACARTLEGNLWCWGLSPGQLKPDGIPTYSVAEMKAAGTVGAIAAGTMAGCWTTGSLLSCSGDKDANGEPFNYEIPYNVVSIAVGAYGKTVCILRADHSVSCAGDGTDGALGVLGLPNSSTFVVAIPEGAIDLVAADSSVAGFCTLFEDDRVRCWGNFAAVGFQDVGGTTFRDWSPDTNPNP